MTTKKKRGRPIGSSPKNERDFHLLEQVADRIVREPSLKPTTAMKAIGVMGHADQRRLRDKWAMVSEDYLRDARSRLAREREAAAAALRLRIASDAMVVSQSLQQLVAAATGRIHRLRQDNPHLTEQLATAAQALRDLHLSHAPTTIAQFLNHPPSAIRHLLHSPPSAVEQALRRSDAEISLLKQLSRHPWER